MKTAVKEICIDCETVPCLKALPFVPVNGPRDRTDPAEKVAFDSNYIRPCVIGMYDGERAWTLGLNDFPSEAEMLAAFWAEVAPYNKFIGFNSLSFDVPLLIKRSWYHNVEPSVQISLRKYDLMSNHIDVRAVLGNWDVYARGNLDLYANLKFGECKTAGCDGSMVGQMWADGKYDEVKAYCLQDCLITWKLYQSLKGFYIPVRPVGLEIHEALAGAMTKGSDNPFE
jgi:DNA polymerase elongation subunit (family B)